MTELPASARLKLAQIIGQANDAQDAASSAHRRIGELRAALSEASGPRAGDLEHELARLSGLRDQQRERHSALAGLAANVSNWLRGVPGTSTLEPARIKLIKPKDGETLSKAVLRIRAEIAQAQSELKAARTAPPTRAELKAKAAQQVLRLVQEGKPRITSTGELDFSANTHGIGARKVASIVAWVDPDRVLAALARDIDQMPEQQNAMSGDKKKTIMARLTADIDRLERDEEALIEQAQAEGVDIARRAMAAPAAVLGVVLKTREANAA